MTSLVRPSLTMVSLTGPSIFLVYEVSDTQLNRIFLDLVATLSNQWQ